MMLRLVAPPQDRARRNLSMASYLNWIRIGLSWPNPYWYDINC